MCPLFAIDKHPREHTFIAYHNANKQFHVTHDSKHDSVAMAPKKVKEQKVQLAFCNCHFVCGFFTLIGPLRHIKNAPDNKKCAKKERKNVKSAVRKNDCNQSFMLSIVQI
jgi:hypothetical protein